MEMRNFLLYDHPQHRKSKIYATENHSRENGCLQIIPGSHKLGRLNHGRSGDLASVDQERLDAITKVLGDPVLVETEPGDVLFFHRFVKINIFPK